MRFVFLILMIGVLPLASAAQTTTITRITALSEDETISAALENPLLVSLSDAATRTVLKTISFSEPATSVALNKWGGILYVGTEGGAVTAYNTTTSKILWQSPQLSVRPITALSRWDDQVLAVDAQSQPVLLSARTGSWDFRETASASLQTIIPTPPETNKPVAAQLLEDQIRILQDNGATLILPKRSNQWVRRKTEARDRSEAIKKGLEILNARPVPTYKTITQSVVVQPAEEITRVVPDGSGGFVTRTIAIPGQFSTIQRRVIDQSTTSTESAGRFPWPPPLTDSFLSFDGQQLLAKGYVTFGAVDDLLKESLTTAKYSAPVYLSGPEDGFIMLTRLENIDANGVPKPDPGRFGINARVNDDFSIGDFIRIFLNGADPGYYRIIAFAVSKTVDLTQEPAPTEAAALGWLDAGESISLPDAIEGNPITDAHELTVLVYEFEKQNKVDPARLTRGPRLPMDRHIAPMGLAEKLQ
jgi:hypothetical protein